MAVRIKTLNLVYIALFAVLIADFSRLFNCFSARLEEGVSSYLRLYSFRPGGSSSV